MARTDKTIQDTCGHITRKSHSGANGLDVVKALYDNTIANGTNSCTPTTGRLRVMVVINNLPVWMS